MQYNLACSTSGVPETIGPLIGIAEAPDGLKAAIPPAANSARKILRISLSS
jgi:hypothetical protein